VPHALETIQRFSWSTVSITCLALALSLAVPSATPAQAEEATDPGLAYSISRGGKLYDNWMTVLKASKPSETHPAWPASNTKRSGDVTWRCKSCHGWDLMGRDGAYAKGSYETGIKGLKALDGGKPAAVIAVMKHASHGFDGLLSEADFVDLANFVTRGQIGFSTVINYADKSVTGDKAHGKDLYQTLCVACHGLDGREPKEMDALGALAAGNPQEVLHKIRVGQPGEQMPGMHSLPVSMQADLLAYLQDLPRE